MQDNILFEARQVTKQYGETTALKNINLQFYAGEIIGLIGENGAGKSTLLKIISGVEKASSGTVWLHNAPFSCDNMIHANKAGVGMVFQEQSLINNLTVAQNIYLGREHLFRKFGVIQWAAMNRAAKTALEAVGVLNISGNQKVSSLNFAAKQMIEIAKVFDIVSSSGTEHALILLDEPTSVLGTEEITQLFTQVRKLRDAGHTIVFVSHRLDEVLALTDRIYVFKDGENAGCMHTSDATEDLLYEKMVGRNTTDAYFKTHRQTVPEDKVVLEVRNLSRYGVYRDIHFSLHAGEVLGLCGVEGSGKEEICNAICGDEPADQGEIIIHNQVRKLHSPHKALKHGILAIPKERREEGMISILHIADNIMLSNLQGVSSFGILSKGKQNKQAQTWITSLGIKCLGAHTPMQHLSGGNAQKVVFARAMASKLDVLILNHPTRGVDVGSREDIYNLIRDITASGVSVLLLGDTLDECIGLSSRIIVMKDGEMHGEFTCNPDGKPTQLEIIQHMM